MLHGYVSTSYLPCICIKYVSDTGYDTDLAYQVNTDKNDMLVGRDGGGRELNGGRMCMNKG